MLGIAGAAIGFVIAVLVGVAIGLPNAYDRGYCDALGGQWLTIKTCNVEGKVVNVP